jgi:phage recombination protein Bet
MTTPAATTAIQPAPQQSKLLEVMAAQYQLDGLAFKNVLLKTVFPQDKPVTLEQLASFCAVAHEYKLNPLIREIFAFPSKSGGIIPIVSVDGWITMVQRHPQYNGHSFVHEWKDGQVGGELISMTCIMRRKDREFPIENTEFMDECRRDTDPWKKWPSRMLRHKCFIQSARYAFGLSGIYDEDEAERILEAERTINVTPVREIQMPQRQQPALPNSVFVPEGVAQNIVLPETQTIEIHNESTARQVEAEPETTPPVLEGVENLFDGGAPAETPAEASEPVRTIGKAKAQRIHAIATTKKTRTDAEFEELKRAFKITNLADLPEINYPDVENWVAKTE